MGTRRIRKDDGSEYTLFFRKVSPFSNHFPAEFTTDQAIFDPATSDSEMKRFSCTEQFYMYNKATLFNDKKKMSEVLKSKNPKSMKKIATEIAGWDEKKWKARKLEVMSVGTLEKYRQCAHVRFLLFISNGSHLYECSPFDKYWGIGRDIEDAEEHIPDGLNGENMLGKVLEKVRDKLWNDEEYIDERQDIEKRIKNIPDYQIRTTKKLDLIYKDRANQCFSKARKREHQIKHSELDEEGLELIPEWARPPKLDQDDLDSCSTPPVICDFDRPKGRDSSRRKSPLPKRYARSNSSGSESPNRLRISKSPRRTSSPNRSRMSRSPRRSSPNRLRISRSPNRSRISMSPRRSSPYRQRGRSPTQSKLYQELMERRKRRGNDENSERTRKRRKSSSSSSSSPSPSRSRHRSESPKMFGQKNKRRESSSSSPCRIVVTEASVEEKTRRRSRKESESPNRLQLSSSAKRRRVSRSPVRERSKSPNRLLISGESGRRDSRRSFNQTARRSPERTPRFSNHHNQRHAISPLRSSKKSISPLRSSRKSIETSPRSRKSENGRRSPSKSLEKSSDRKSRRSRSPRKSSEHKSPEKSQKRKKSETPEVETPVAPPKRPRILAPSPSPTRKGRDVEKRKERERSRSKSEEKMRKKKSKKHKKEKKHKKDKKRKSSRKSESDDDSEMEDDKRTRDSKSESAKKAQNGDKRRRVEA